MLQELIPALILQNDQALPMSGLGLHRIDHEEEMETAVQAALDCGVRLFDTASFYKNEDLLGDVLAASGVPRSELFLTTKIWNTAQQLGDIRGSVERSLERLRVEYLDLYLIHWPVPGCYPETWQQLLVLQEEGLLRSIGVSNFEVPHLEALYAASDVWPMVNQFECHPLWNRTELIEYCQNHGIAVQACAPLARGTYQDRSILQQIGDRYGKSAAQTGLRYLVQQNISVIPKSVDPTHIRQNASLFDFSLTDLEMQAIAQMDEGVRTSSIPDDVLSMYTDL